MANNESDDKKTGTRFLDGMVLVDEETVREGRRVTATLLAAFRYGREDLDALGLTFRKDLISQQYQVYPPNPSQPSRPLTRLQERLKRKLGDLAFPFLFEVPPRSASSVTLQPAPGDTGKPCGVDYELKTVVGGVDSNTNDRQLRKWFWLCYWFESDVGEGRMDNHWNWPFEEPWAMHDVMRRLNRILE
ncbi:arsenicals resistance [Parelaphostrongylus tenuis]|uniref:Arsenicals resistance n=1 Tax=Parelaphostrongylus tenuis TaxID=148309 RepID=A0AAD5WF50_PARTN|nr:arsenicals resistance [Parelaphostrongylus tenuis]